MKNFLKKHYKKIIIGLFLILLFTLGIKWKMRVDKQSADPQSKAYEERLAQQPPYQALGTEQRCVSNPDPVFTSPFTDLTKIEALGPLGAIKGGSTSRSYIKVKRGEKESIYNPVDSILETVIYAPRGPNLPPEYGLYFRVSCEVVYLFDHLTDVSDEIRQYAPQEPAKNTATQNGTQPNKLIKAGTYLGFADATQKDKGFDFLLLNNAKEPFRINPSRWTWDQTKFGSCPYDYFSESLRAEYHAMIGVPSRNGLIKGKDCGSTSADISGTISGGWFKGESTDAKGEYLGIHENPASVDYVIRTDGQVTFYVRDWNKKTTPEKVTVGKTHCIADEGKYAFLKLLSDKQLSVIRGTGICPSAFPESQAELWER